jgi:hypothetical protein
MNGAAVDEFRFEVALSFAGDNKREKVREVSEILRKELGPGRVFFDEWFEAELAGPDAHLVLQQIYRHETHVVVTCVCKRYAEKPWTQEEWRAIQSLERELRDAGTENTRRMRFLPLRFGDGEVDGLFDMAIVPDVRQRTARAIADLILERVRLSHDRRGTSATLVRECTADARSPGNSSRGSLAEGLVRYGKALISTPILGAWVLVVLTSLLLVTGYLFFFRSPGARWDASSHFGPELSFQTGWVFLGFTSADGTKYIKGPFLENTYSPSGAGTVTYPMKGDILRVTRPRNIIIARFKERGLEHRLTPPGLISGWLTDTDETGVLVPEGKLLQVEDCAVTKYPGPEMLPAVWCRITTCSVSVPQCVIAARGL